MKPDEKKALDAMIDKVLAYKPGENKPKRDRRPAKKRANKKKRS